MDPLARLAQEGFTFITIDLSKGAYVIAWNKPHRKNCWARGANIDCAVDEIIAQLHTKPLASMFEDILG